MEHPSSLLVPVNATVTAGFSCTAQCASSPCELVGQWIINNRFASRCHGRDQLILTLMLNTSEVRNSSKIRCYFEFNGISSTGEHEDSESANLVLMDGELLYA